MSQKFNYTQQALNFTYRHPLLSYLGIQINFWVIAYVLLMNIIYLANLIMINTRGLDIPLFYTPVFFSGIVIGVVYGSVLGLIDFKLDQQFSTRLSLGVLILIRTVIYGLILVFIMFVIRYMLWEKLFIVYFYEASEYIFSDTTWRNLFYLFGMYTVVLVPSISFINQINRKFGPGVLVPMLLGKYRTPFEEERLFMLLDMKSSTTHAEELGHHKYSLLVQDCFHDLDEAIMRFRAEIYQYVGDEVVISWRKSYSNDEENCLDFFFSCQRKFQDRRDYYEKKYGFVPIFKAGVHRGLVMAVEVGNIKREIAYHGDTINTAARIQSLCNTYGKIILISKNVAVEVKEKKYKTVQVGEIELKGKLTKTELYGVELVEE